jgi:type I restriction enzyme S subunit
MRKYPTYKPSGIQWAGEIPAHWIVKKFKFGSSTINGFAFASDMFSDSEGVPLIRIRDIANNKTETFFRGNFPETAIVENGDLLVGMDGDFLLQEWKGPKALLNQRVCKLLPQKNFIKGYLRFTGQFPLNVINDVTYFVTVKHLSDNDIKNCIFPIPSLLEQQSIVRFLDYKTGQIDSFIANRQKQIDLLKEQLHFKINKAITKGIKSKAKFKPTDIKYVPEIPEHWDIRKFKSLTSILTCGVAATPEYVEESEGVAFLSAQNCRPFAMDLAKYSYIKPSLHKQLTRHKKPKRGDVLVTRVGAGIGQACIIDTDLEFSVYVSLTHIRPNKEILSEYIVYFFNTEYCYQLNLEGTVVGGGQGNLNVKNVERYRIPLPPIEEQKEIIQYLDNYRTETNTLISKYQKQIDLMREYRTSLIRQVVTGKFDVGEWHPKKKGEA